MASLQLDDSIHNLLFSFLKNRTHSTKFLNKTSSALSTNSSVVQSSVLGPSSFIINASSLKPVHPLNKMIKFADDTYLVIPSSNSNSLQLELDSLSEWAKLSNLSLNLKKSYELIIHNNYNKITPLVFIHLSTKLLPSLSWESHSLKLSTSHLTLTILLQNLPNVSCALNN